MRCDVCDTKIPPGSNICPNCGYRVRESSTATHKQTISTEYPESEVFKAKRKRKFKVNQETLFKTTRQTTKYIYVIIFIIVLSFAMPLIGAFLFDSQTSSNNAFSTEDVSGESLQEGMDSGYDDGTMQIALDYKDELMSFFNDELLFEDIDSRENYYIFDDDLITHINVYGYESTLSLTVSLQFQQQQPQHQVVVLSWNNQGSIQNNPISIDSKKLEKINDKFDVDIVGVIDEYKSKLEVDEEDQTRYVVSEYNDDRDIYFSETVEEDESFVYLSIGKDIEH